jgi:hypothetical protein
MKITMSRTFIPKTRLAPATLRLGLSLAFVLVGSSVAGVESSGATSTGTLVWTELSPAQNPPANWGPEVAYDRATGRLVLFGGAVGDGTDTSATWQFNGTTWSQVAPTTSPQGGRFQNQLVYDAAARKIVLFGGAKGNETWTFNGSSWTQLFPAKSPPPRDLAAVAFDARTGDVVLFGGLAGNGDAALGDMWSFNGSTWTQVKSKSGPPALYGARMAYDPLLGKVVFFGGRPFSGNYSSATYTFDGVTWKHIALPKNIYRAPGGRTEFGMAYDNQLRGVVIYGNDRYRDTWEFNGTWQQLRPRSLPFPVGSQISMDYDARTKSIIFFGTGDFDVNNETWALNGMP